MTASLERRRGRRRLIRTHGCDLGSWFAFIPLLAIAGFGFGLGWTFANVATQDVVDTERAGEASGVVLTVLVSFGGFGLAIVATAIASLERAGHTPQFAYFGSLRVVAIVTVAWAAIVMVIRAVLVRRGLMPPLSMKAPWPPPVRSEPAGSGARTSTGPSRSEPTPAGRRIR